MSASLFVLLGTVNFIGAILSVISFFVFFLVYYKNFADIRMKTSSKALLCLTALIVVIRERGFYYIAVNSRKLQELYRTLRLAGTVAGVQLGAIILLIVLGIISSYSIILIVSSSSSFEIQEKTMRNKANPTI